MWDMALSASDIGFIGFAIFWLVLLEGLLSADNALVLAVMVRKLPKDQQTRALRYGIWGAYAFRLVAVISANYLLQFWQLKVVGGLYLLGLALKNLLAGHEEIPSTTDEMVDGEDAPSAPLDRRFWMTVVNVELADIFFSIDSILAAVATVRGLPDSIQNNTWISLGIVYIGGILGITMMRAVAGFFILLLERFKGLAAGAYLLVAWIGIKLVGSGIHDALHPRDSRGRVIVDPEILHQGWRASVPAWVENFPWEMNDGLFWLVMSLIVFGCMMYRPRRSNPDAPAHPG